MTSQIITVKLSRGDNTSWGFRLQGGKDFSTPLSVQRVNPGSLADNAGLIPGDAILKISGMSTENLRHKEAQDCIIRSGNNLELVVQRGGIRVWKPTVAPVGDLPTHTISPPPPSAPSVFTKTSLAANKQEFKPIGSQHNVAPKPFANLGDGKLLVNKQYNSPAPLYSMNNIAETLSAHTEVLASGAKGINFMKEPGPVNKQSAVYKMIMEENQRSEDFNHVDKKDPSATKHVSAPVTKPMSQMADKENDPNACVECGKTIIGVFVRIKDKSMHPDCFRCSTCGTSLKNIGYFNVNDKLYCDMHAKAAAKVVSSTPIYEPMTMSHMGPAPEKPALTLATSPTPQTPVSAPLSPSSAGYRSVSPTPFHKGGEIHHVEAPTSPQTIMSPPLFKQSSAAPPFSTTPYKPSPLSQTSVHSMSAGINTPHTGPSGGSKFVWPPPKNAPVAEPVVVSNSTPAPRTYRPPPGTQHVITGLPKSSSSPLSPPVSSSSTTSSSSPFGVHLSGPKKIPPPTSPKPHTPVQAAQRHQGQAAGSGTGFKWSTSGVSSTSATSSGGILMTTGTGSRPAPRRGRGQMKPQVGTGSRIPICSICGTPIRGPFVTALGKTWCPDHFICANNRCQRPLLEIGFVENHGLLYCEMCYEVHLAPICAKCACRIKGDCLSALDKQWHPECFVCAHCHKPFGNNSFYMEDRLPYCEKDWSELFTTKCVVCGFPIEAGDRWVEALNNNYHSQCFKCTICHRNLEGQSFYAKGGRPFCKTHAR